MVVKLNEPNTKMNDTNTKMNEPNKRRSSLYRCCMVAGAGKRNGNRAKTTANQDREQVPEKGGESKTWDLDKT